MEELILKARQKSSLLKQQDIMPELAKLITELADSLEQKKEQADSYMYALCEIDKLRCSANEVLASESNDGYYEVPSMKLDAVFRGHPQDKLNIFRRDTILSLEFPTMLRKNWSGGEVEQWLVHQANRQQQKESNDE